MSKMQRCSNWAVALVCLLAGGVLLSTGTISHESSDAGADELATSATLVDISWPMHGFDPHQNQPLHRATIRDWHAAAEHEQLTAAVAMVVGARGPQDEAALQDCAATALARCISEATSDMIMDNARIVDVAAACLQMLDY